MNDKDSSCQVRFAETFPVTFPGTQVTSCLARWNWCLSPQGNYKLDSSLSHGRTTPNESRITRARTPGLNLPSNLLDSSRLENSDRYIHCNNNPHTYFVNSTFK